MSSGTESTQEDESALTQSRRRSRLGSRRGTVRSRKASTMGSPPAWAPVLPIGRNRRRLAERSCRGANVKWFGSALGLVRAEMATGPPDPAESPELLSLCEVETGARRRQFERWLLGWHAARTRAGEERGGTHIGTS
eukprot:gene49325-16941_t